MNSETVFAGVFQLLAPLAPVADGGNGTFVTISRRLDFVDKMDAEALPAVFQNQVTRNPSSGYTTSDGITFEVFTLDWYVYAYTPDQTLPTTPILNPLVDAVMNVIPAPGNMLLVNGSPVGFRISGPIIYTEGLLGNFAVARIPIELKASADVQ